MDLIERQAAIDAVRSYYDEFDDKDESIENRIEKLPSAQPDLQPTCNQLATDCISRQAAIDALMEQFKRNPTIAIRAKLTVEGLPSAQPEIKPHRNYKYLSDYWCECGWHLGKKGTVKYCANCGRKVKWDE